jgi:hypothetical protein
MLSDDPDWLEAKHQASIENGWFIPGFIELAVKNTALNFLNKDILNKWVTDYHIPAENPSPKTIGIVMAGNIPLVGFHDFIAAFITGNRMRVKPSSKDSALIKHIVHKLAEWNKEVNDLISFSEMLKGCDVYIATGSNNSSRYFEYYFGKYPHIIRRNRTSVAFIKGDETQKELENLASDVYQYFGLGCRNVTKIYVPANYDFTNLLNIFGKYNYLADHHKYKNNYDYNLALHLLNKKFYMTNGSVILSEDNSLFSPISQLNYEFYSNEEETAAVLWQNKDVQCIVGRGYVPFGSAQCPSINDYADGVDTMQFISNLQKAFA